MVFRKLNFDRQTASFPELVAVVLVWMCAMPLAAQSSERTERAAGAGSGSQPGGLTPAASNRAVSRMPETADAVIEQMAAAAGVIFAGQVTAVRRPVGFGGSGQDAAAGVVEIDLRVERSLRGPGAGSIYTLREWAGIWAGGMERYKAGQRLLLFLYAPDAAGLSAPVYGAAGAVPLRGSGAAPGPDDASTTAAEWLVDLRWLQAQALRKQGYEALPVRKPGGPVRPIRGPVSEETYAVPSKPGFGEVASERSGPPSGSVVEPGLIYAIRDPWAIPAAAPVEAQPLSQVLALCQQAVHAQALSDNVTRHRNGDR